MRIKFLHNFFPNLRRALEYFVLGWKDYDYDYASILDLEEKKIKHMVHYFKKYGMTVDSPQVARELELLLSLIRIIREGGNTYTIDVDPVPDSTDSTFSVPDFMTDYFNRHHIRRLKYVNVRNANRFLNEEELELLNDEKHNHLRAAWEEDLYLRKAVHLYCKLKEERMLTWAD